MRIAILSREPKGYSVSRFKAAAAARDHTTRVLDPLKFSILVEEQEPRLLYGGKPLPRFDAVIPRIEPRLTFFGTAIVRQLEQMGVFVLNTSQAISVSRDKLRALQILSRHDIGMPPSAFIRDREDVLPAIRQVGGAPVIIKVLEGTQGVGVILAEEEKVAEAIIETLQVAKQNVLVQRFVSESRGKDIRALVVGDRVVAAMRRQAQGQEFRSNVHRGGKTEAVELEEAYLQAAVQAAQILGLRVSGVDMLESQEGPQIMEVNSSPGLEGIETCTGVDVAGAVIELIEEQVLFPDIDLRQRLTLKAGYGVSELTLDRKSPLANVSIADSKLREQEVLVLTIQRGDVVMPNPPASEVLLVGDRLLCFGKLLTLKGLVPTPRRRARKRQAAVPPTNMEDPHG